MMSYQQPEVLFADRIGFRRFLFLFSWHLESRYSSVAFTFFIIISYTIARLVYIVNMTSSSSTCEDVVDNSSHRPLHVLLGVTGSVAAVKSPEIAVQLVRQKSFPSGIIVKVLLTQGGRTFWNQALQYNAVAWDEFEKEIVKKRIVILGMLKVIVPLLVLTVPS